MNCCPLKQLLSFDFNSFNSLLVSYDTFIKQKKQYVHFFTFWQNVITSFWGVTKAVYLFERNLMIIFLS